MLKIVVVPNKILTSTVKPVKKIDKKIVELVNQMAKTLDAQVDPQGVGLAAPQVGEDLALFIVKKNKKAKLQVFINPKIIKHSNQVKDTIGVASEETLREADSARRAESLAEEKQHERQKLSQKKKPPQKLEGCLSIPRIWSPITRSGRILLEYQDLAGEVKKQWFGGFDSIIIQHEVDHLRGIMFTQRALEQNIPLYEEKDGELEKLKY